MANEPLIFGIGFPRTGTTSLRSALKVLDVVEVANPIRLKRDLYRGNLRLPAEWAATVGGLGNFYIALDKLYPGSKFILTTRDEDAWLDSVKRVWHVDKRPAEYDVRLPGLWPHFGLLSYDLDVLRAIYRSHVLGVQDYFQGRNDLLVIALETVTWEPLCTFLNKPVPSEPFPYENQWKAT